MDGIELTKTGEIALEFVLRALGKHLPANNAENVTPIMAIEASLLVMVSIMSNANDFTAIEHLSQGVQHAIWAQHNPSYLGDDNS